MAEAAASDLLRRGRPIASLVASPLQRTRESAAPVAAAFDLPVSIDDRLIEPSNHFEGKRLRGPHGALRDPRNWPALVNPLRPSWGEPFRFIAERMLAAINAAGTSVADDEGDVVLVSHQLPIWMAHRALAGERLAHDPRKRRCELSSITTLSWRGDHYEETGYVSPATALLTNATDVGAV
jgi:broad specificity phosphatase PhoE